MLSNRLQLVGNKYILILTPCLVTSCCFQVVVES